MKVVVQQVRQTQSMALRPLALCSSGNGTRTPACRAGELPGTRRVFLLCNSHSQGRILPCRGPVCAWPAEAGLRGGTPVPTLCSRSPPTSAPVLQVLLEEEREAMAKSRRLERSAGSFGYSSYHTLGEVGLLRCAPASAFRS